MNNKVGIVVVVVIAAAAIAVDSFQQQKVAAGYGELNPVSERKAPIATSGDKNVYISWPSNKTGNDEVGIYRWW
jgi:hypothetical protein